MILKYLASSGNEYNLNIKEEFLTREANYHVWNWVANGTELQFGKRIANFSREAAVYSATLTVIGSQLFRKNMLDSLHEDFELDVRNMTPGRIIWGDYYIDCYITDSSTKPDDYPTWTDNEISIYCPYPFWIKEETHSISPQEVPAGQTFLDYEYDYNYDYFYGTPGIAIWQTELAFSSKFRMIIYGPVSDPRVQVNGYPYQVFNTLTENEYLIIDSRDNTITKYMGVSTVNLFDQRDKTHSIFRDMPKGTLRFNWSGAFGFELTLFEERSEPR